MGSPPEERREGSTDAGGGKAWIERARVSGKKLATRLSVDGAAEALGVISAVLWGHVRRNTVPHERDEHGRVNVLVGASSNIGNPDHNLRRIPEDVALIEELRAKAPKPHMPSKPLRETPAGPNEPECPVAPAETTGNRPTTEGPRGRPED